MTLRKILHEKKAFCLMMRSLLFLLLLHNVPTAFIQQYEKESAKKLQCFYSQKVLGTF